MKIENFNFEVFGSRISKTLKDDKLFKVEKSFFLQSETFKPKVTLPMFFRACA